MVTGNVLLTIERTTELGFERWAVKANGRTVRTFWSEAQAMTFAKAAEAQGLGLFVESL